MVNIKDILISLALTIALFISFEWVVISRGLPLLILPLFLLYYTILVIIKRQKKIMPYVQQDFKDLGYEVLEERPLRWSEIKILSEIRIADSATVAMRRMAYVRRFERVFRVRKTITGALVDLQTTVTREWGGQNTIEIVSEEEVSAI